MRPSLQTRWCRPSRPVSDRWSRLTRSERRPDGYRRQSKARKRRGQSHEMSVVHPPWPPVSQRHFGELSNTRRRTREVVRCDPLRRGSIPIAEVAVAGEREMRLAPLVGTLKAPRLFHTNRFEAQPVQAAVDKMGQT